MNAREALAQIERKHGYLTPHLVVEEARPASSPLHQIIFDRSAKEAAEAWYLHRAQELIQSIRVRVEHHDGEEPLVIRRYVSVLNEQHGRVYQDAEKVAADPITKEIVLREMERDWRQLRERYEKYEEFWRLIASEKIALAT